MHSYTSYINNAPQCEPRRSQIDGIGLFAKVKIKAKEPFMTLSGGRIVAVSSYFENEAGLIEDEWNAISERELLVRKNRTYYYFINHQFSPNAIVDIVHKRVVASADISAHEEITINYLFEPLPKLYLEKWGASFLQRINTKFHGLCDGQPRLLLSKRATSFRQSAPCI